MVASTRFRCATSIRPIRSLVKWIAVGQREQVGQVHQDGTAWSGNREDGKYVVGGKPWWPEWLVSLVGVDYLGSVVRVIVTLDGSDAVLEKISGLGRMEDLIFTSSAPTEAGIAHLGWLTGLKYLDLSKSAVIDGGLSHLKSLSRLRWLIVKNCPVSDAGLAHIRFLTQLEGLGLNGTQITDAGLVHLKGLGGSKTCTSRGRESGMKSWRTSRGLRRFNCCTSTARMLTDAGLTHLKGVYRSVC